jgi:hypothetical protein
VLPRILPQWQARATIEETLIQSRRNRRHQTNRYKAASENDAVVVYTSSSDRIKKGEFPIKGDDFVRLWSDVFIPALPKNVRVKFVDSPVRAVMHEIAWLEQTTVQDNAKVPVINLYSDKDDVDTNFKDEDLKKYPSLLAAGKIKKVGVERTATVNVSGTKMREFLLNNDKASFLKYLPPVSTRDKEEIWNTLIKNKPVVNETNPYSKFAEEVVNEIFVTFRMIRSPFTQTHHDFVLS